MKPKTVAILYWSVTSLSSFVMLMAGIVEMMRSAEGQEIMRHLGYPVYILTIIGLGKIMGALTIAQNRFRTLKEWAYAGFTINLLGAAASRAYAGDSVGLVVSPLLFLSVMLASYFLWKKWLVQHPDQSSDPLLWVAAESGAATSPSRSTGLVA